MTDTDIVLLRQYELLCLTGLCVSAVLLTMGALAFLRAALGLRK